MRYPCDGVITQGFSGGHPALDMAFVGGGSVSYGKPIYAPESGQVTYVGPMGSGIYNAGTVVQITTSNRVHRLCHLIPGSPRVTVGQNVAEGEIVGGMGWSGYVLPANFEGTHLHWVMEINGQRVDGRDYITNSAPSAGGNAVDLIKSMYLRLLGRDADQNGINHYSSQANSKGWDFVYNDLRSSSEGQRDWERRNPARVALLETKEAEANALRDKVAQLEVALRNEQSKPPREVIKEVEKIVEKPVIVEVPVGGLDEETKNTLKETNTIAKAIKDLLTRIFK